MTLYSLSQRTLTNANNQAIWEIRTGATVKPKIYELGITTPGTQGIFGLGVPQAIGISPTNPQTFVDESDGNGPASTTTAAVAWGTGPTIPLGFVRGLNVSSNAGGGIITSFPRGLEIAKSNSIVLWAHDVLASAMDVYAVIEE